MKNISLEKLYTKCDGETSPKSLFKRSKLSISQDQQFAFIIWPNQGLPKYIKTKY